MELGLDGKTVLVTGGSKGIGQAVAAGFAAEGCRLHLAARTEADLEAVAEQLRADHGAEVAVHPIDLSQGANVEKLASACAEADILVNNAGAIPPGDIASIDEARWREAWDLKVFGYINMTRAFYKSMRERGGGVILNVIGLAGEKPSFGYAAGATGNASLMAFTRAIGGASLEDGLRVLAVNPGAVQTERIVTLFRDMAEKQLGDAERYPEFFEKLPLGRAATPEEVANVVVFLASDRASYLSGIVVPIDGGFASRN